MQDRYALVGSSHFAKPPWQSTALRAWCRILGVYGRSTARGFLAQVQMWILLETFYDKGSEERKLRIHISVYRIGHAFGAQEMTLGAWPSGNFCFLCSERFYICFLCSERFYSAPLIGRFGSFVVCFLAECSATRAIRFPLESCLECAVYS